MTTPLLDMQTHVNVPSSRLVSVDTFRGFVVVLMIMTNTAGAGIPLLYHSGCVTSKPPTLCYKDDGWNGITVADWIWATFLFLIGVSMSLSLRNMFSKANPPSKQEILLKILKRCIILCLLGYYLNTVPAFTFNRTTFLGVLPHIGYSNLIAAPVILLSPNEYVMIAIAWTFLIIWTLVTYLAPYYEGCPLGYMGPGEASNDYLCAGGVSAYIDQKVFSWLPMDNRPDGNSWWQHYGVFRAPLLGLFTTSSIIISGYWAGRKLPVGREQYTKELKDCSIRLIGVGVFLFFLGAGLCQFHFEQNKDKGWMPLAQTLWTPSFGLVCSGINMCLLFGIHVLIDHHKIWNGKPFLYPGMNTLAIFLLSEWLPNVIPNLFNHNKTKTEALIVAGIVDSSYYVIYCLLYAQK